MRGEEDTFLEHLDMKKEMIEEEIRPLKAELAHLGEHVDSTLQKQKEMDTSTWYKLTVVGLKLGEAIDALEDGKNERRR